jgi:hypothetical protein
MIIVLCILVAGPVGCEEPPSSAPPPATKPKEPGPAWKLTKVGVIEGFKTPESVLIDPATSVGYVSNVEAEEGQYWSNDGKGFISRLLPGGKLDVLRWKTGVEDYKLSSPRGMCLYAGALYVADNTRVCRIALDAIAPEGPIEGLQGKRLNDIATDGDAVYVSDTAAGRVYRILGPSFSDVKAPEGVNGITFHGAKMFAVSWTTHDVYELDPAGKEDPRPFGLARHFRALDGIKILDDGTFIVTDYLGNKVCSIAPDRKTVHTLCKATTPADLGLGRRGGLLFVPQFEADSVVIYRLEKAEDVGE